MWPLNLTCACPCEGCVDHPRRKEAEKMIRLHRQQQLDRDRETEREATLNGDGEDGGEQELNEWVKEEAEALSLIHI